MTHANTRMAVAIGGMVGALLFSASALANDVCANDVNPKCKQQTDDPQPNAGDSAPGMFDGTASGGAAAKFGSRPPPAAAATLPEPAAPKPEAVPDSATDEPPTGSGQ